MSKDLEQTSIDARNAFAEENRKNALKGPEGSNVGKNINANRPDREKVNKDNEKIESNKK